MLKLDFLVIFQFVRVIFGDFVPILEGYPVSVCPNHPDRDFFCLNYAPWLFYGLYSGFLLRRDELKSSLLTFFDFRFSA